MNYEEALHYLDSIQRTGMSFGVARMEILAQRMGNLERFLKFIHVAGTNGKGSTCVFCASALEEAGYKVGLFTSPHLIRFNERFQVNRRPIPDNLLAEGVAAIRPHIEAARSDGPDAVPTCFEALTALALWYFAREKVDWVVCETGMGGRLDATNIIAPAVSVITSISLDHTRWLGATTPEIAREKAGIIKSGVPVIAAPHDKEALEVIRAVAMSQNAPLTVPGLDTEETDGGIRRGKQHARLNGTEYLLGLAGPHQVDNAACALAALQSLTGRNLAVITAPCIERGFERAQWPARFQVLQDDPPLILDGAHNAAAAIQLLDTWRSFYGATRFDLVCGFLADKDYAAMLRVLLPQAARVSLVGLSSERGATPAQLRACCGSLPAQEYAGVVAAWPEIIARAQFAPTLICGSLYLAGEILACLEKRTNQLQPNERLEPVAALAG
jgi:dihydrofolate synthase/folylpolyglutamate synthase